MKKAWEIVSTVFVWILVVVAVAMMIFTVVSVNTFNRNDRSLFGYKAYVVLSDSMSATDFNAGDLIMVKEVDPTTLVPGDIIAYTSQDTDNYGATITHKIRALTTSPEGYPGFITYGTTTNVDDEQVVTYPFVLGKYEFRLAKVGTFFQFLKTTQGYIVCILIPFLLLILYQGLNCVKIFRMYKAEQMAELQAEKDALEEQRKQSEAMMAQLLEMKNQMASQAPPAQQPAAGPDVAAMMAELEALRAQVAGQNAPKAEPTTADSELDAILAEFGSDNQ